jgi:hypothetical protein
MLLNMPVQMLKGGNPTTGVRSGSLVTHPRELILLPGHNVKTKQDGQLDGELWQENLSENGKSKILSDVQHGM